MGFILSPLKKVFNYLSGEREYKIVILGLSNAGKTTLLNKLHDPGSTEETMPTITFNLESLSFANVKLFVWDLAGQKNIRKYWPLYFKNAAGVVFVVDLSDKETFEESKEELIKLLRNEELNENAVSFLVFGNKIDLSQAKENGEMFESIFDFQNKKWTEILGERQIQWFKSSFTESEGVKEGFEWLVSEMNNTP